jgi:hypothetical protein
VEIWTFCQSEKESIGAAWARFFSLAQSSPDLSLPDHLLLQHLYKGLSKENAQYLKITAGGSFTHKTPAEEGKSSIKSWKTPPLFASVSLLG